MMFSASGCCSSRRCFASLTFAAAWEHRAAVCIVRCPRHGRRTESCNLSAFRRHAASSRKPVMRTAQHAVQNSKNADVAFRLVCLACRGCRVSPGSAGGACPRPGKAHAPRPVLPARLSSGTRCGCWWGVHCMCVRARDFVLRRTTVSAWVGVGLRPAAARFLRRSRLMPPEVPQSESGMRRPCMSRALYMRSPRNRSSGGSVRAWIGVSKGGPCVSRTAHPRRPLFDRAARSSCWRASSPESCSRRRCR